MNQGGEPKTPESLLEPVINQKLAQIKAQGRAYRLKSKPKKLAIKLIPHTIFLIIGLITFFDGGVLIAIAAVAFAIRKIIKTTDSTIILQLAKKNPKMTIDQLMAQEIIIK